MPLKQRLTWTVVLRLAVVVTGFASLVVLGGDTALWLVEGERPDSTIRSWGDALWWSLTTLTTVGYGDHVPVTTTGRLIAAGVMVAGVAVIGAVAAIVALAVALRVAREEELACEAAAETSGAAPRRAPRSDRGTAGWFGCAPAGVVDGLSR
jgi:voltage-gated potassium channel